MGERVQSLRKEKGLSQEALGEALGVSRQAVSQWENGQVVPEVDKLVALSRLLGLTLDELVLDEKPEAAPPVKEIDPRAEIRKWRPVRPLRMVLAVAITALVAVLVWFFQGGHAPPAAVGTPEPRQVEMERLWEEGGALADFSGGLTGVDYGAGSLPLRLSARPARLGPGARIQRIV